MTKAVSIFYIHEKCLTYFLVCALFLLTFHAVIYRMNDIRLYHVNLYYDIDYNFYESDEDVLSDIAYDKKVSSKQPRSVKGNGSGVFAR